MTYVQAIATAVESGKCVMRPHWCFVKLRYDPQQLKSFIVDIDDDGDREPTRFKPTNDDLCASDWLEV